LSKRFPAARDLLGRPTSWLRAVDFVDLDVYRGETLALVGESGCGKTTLARLVLRVLRASSGSVRFEQMDVLAASPNELRGFRRRVQLVFQDPYASLDPRKRVEWIVITEAAFSFIGFGAQPPTPSLGRMIAEGRDYWSVSIWSAPVPGVAIALIVLGRNSLGDALRDVDPRRQRW
jgi:ABC transporter